MRDKHKKISLRVGLVRWVFTKKKKIGSFDKQGGSKVYNSETNISAYALANWIYIFKICELNDNLK